MISAWVSSRIDWRALDFLRWRGTNRIDTTFHIGFACLGADHHRIGQKFLIPCTQAHTLTTSPFSTSTTCPWRLWKLIVIKLRNRIHQGILYWRSNTVFKNQRMFRLINRVHISRLFLFLRRFCTSLWFNWQVVYLNLNIVWVSFLSNIKMVSVSVT